MPVINATRGEVSAMMTAFKDICACVWRQLRSRIFHPPQASRRRGLIRGGSRMMRFVFLIPFVDGHRDGDGGGGARDGRNSPKAQTQRPISSPPAMGVSTILSAGNHLSWSEFDYVWRVRGGGILRPGSNQPVALRGTHQIDTPT